MTSGELATVYVAIASSAQGLGSAIVRDAESGAAGAEQAGAKAGGLFTKAFGASLAIGAAAVGATTALYNIGATFDDVSDTIRVGTGASGEALAGLAESVKTIGTTIPADFGKIGTTVADLNTRLGLSGTTLETVASQYLEAGRILGEDVDVQSSTAAFNAFGLAGEQIVGAMDDLFRVSQSTGVGMNDLAAAVQQNAPALQNLGFGFSETAALAGTLDKAGLNMTQVMASMSKGLVTLAKDGEEPAEAFRRVTGEIQSLVDQGKTAEAIDLASGVFGTRGASQFVGAVQSGKLALDDLVGAAGVTGDTILGLGAETADFAESWELFKNKTLVGLEPLASKVFDGIGKRMAKAADAVGPAVAKISGAFSEAYGILAKGAFTGGKGLSEDSPLVDFLFTIRESVQAFGKAVGPAFATLGPVLGQLLPLLNPVGAIFKEVLLPVLPQLASVVGLLFEQFVRLAEPLAQLVQSVFPLVVEAFSAAVPPIMGLIGSLVPLVSAVIDLVIPAFETLMPVVVSIFEGLLEFVGPIIAAIAGVITTVIGIFTGDWSKAWEGIKQIVTGVWDAIKIAAGIAWDLIKSFIVTPLQEAWNFITGVFAGIVGFIDTNIWQPISNAASETWDWVYYHIVGPLKDAIKWVEDTFSGIVGKVQRIWDDLKNVFSDGLNAGVLNLDVQSGLSIPGAAHGADILPSRGGTLLRVGEGGDRELVSPIPMLKSIFRSELQMAGGGAGGATYQINVTTDSDPRAVSEAVIGSLREWERLHGAVA